MHSFSPAQQHGLLQNAFFKWVGYLGLLLLGSFYGSPTSALLADRRVTPFSVRHDMTLSVNYR
jgi:hypothetical protein